MKEVKPIQVESLFTDKEYTEMAKKYTNTYTSGNKKIQEFDCEFKWRKS